MPFSPFLRKLAALSIAMVAPLWVTLAWKWPIDTDYIFYATILDAFSEQFWHGDLYPRWLIDTNAGLGSPVFLFYGPLPFYITSLFAWLSPLDLHGFGRSLIGMSFALFVSGLTARRWLKQHFYESDAEKGALLYAGFPYLLIPIYFSFSLPVLWAIALFPLLLEAAHEVTGNGWKAVPKLSLLYALLAFTHPPTFIIFAAIPFAYIVAFTQSKRLLAAAQAVAPILLGLCLAAIYLIPMLANKPFVAPQNFLDGKFSHIVDFLSLHSAVGVCIVLLPLLGLYLEQPKPRQFNRHIWFWLATLGCLFFMVTPLSIPLWESIPPLQFLRYPFRLFIGMLPAAVFIALCWLPVAKSRLIYKGLTVAGLGFAVFYSANAFFFSSKAPSEAILHHKLIAVTEYNTPWMEKAGIKDVRRLPESYLKASDAVQKGRGKVIILSESSRSITFRAEIVTNTATLVFNRFYFPGWEGAKIKEHKALLAVDLPRGSHEIRLSLPWFAGERAGQFVSNVAALALTGWWLAMRRRIRVEKQPDIANLNSL